MKTRRLAATFALLLTAASAAWAMAGIHGKFDPKRPLYHSSWSPGLTRLVNTPERVGGHWVNASDWFHYKGDARAFNRFIAAYARAVKHPQVLLQNGEVFTVLTESGETAQVDYDWELAITGWGRSPDSGTGVQLPVNGPLKIRDVKIPANVSVGFLGSGPQSPDVQRLLREHAAKRKP